LDGPADDFNPDTQTAQTWDTQNELDSTAFSHSGSASAVGVNFDDDYLFTTAIFDNDDEVSRGKPWQRWRVNGTEVKPYAGMGRYARSSGTQNCGNWSGILTGLSSGDTIEVVSEKLANSGVLSADQKHLTGVRLGSLFSSGPVSIFNQSESDVTSTNATFNGLLLAETRSLDIEIWLSDFFVT